MQQQADQFVIIKSISNQMENNNIVINWFSETGSVRRGSSVSLLPASKDMELKQTCVSKPFPLSPTNSVSISTPKGVYLLQDDSVVLLLFNTDKYETSTITGNQIRIIISSDGSLQTVATD